MDATDPGRARGPRTDARARAAGPRGAVRPAGVVHSAGAGRPPGVGRLLAVPRPAAAAGVALAIGLATAAGVLAQQAPRASELFRDADLALGERLIGEHRCVECHARKAGGDGASIYRPKGRIATPGFLRGMVEQCNTELNLGMFPEEVTAVAAVLNRDHYRFD